MDLTVVMHLVMTHPLNMEQVLIWIKEELVVDKVPNGPNQVPKSNNVMVMNSNNQLIITQLIWCPIRISMDSQVIRGFSKIMTSAKTATKIKIKISKTLRATYSSPII